MSNSSIKVNPSGLPNAVEVAVDVVDNTFYPIYKLSYSVSGTEPVDVSTTNPFPTTLFGLDSDGDYTPINITNGSLDMSNVDMVCLLENLIDQVKITNAQLAIMTGTPILADELE